VDGNSSHVYSNYSNLHFTSYPTARKVYRIAWSILTIFWNKSKDFTTTGFKLAALKPFFDEAVDLFSFLSIGLEDRNFFASSWSW
jgi:hypothetical protein